MAHLIELVRIPRLGWRHAARPRHWTGSVGKGGPRAAAAAVASRVLRRTDARRSRQPSSAGSNSPAHIKRRLLAAPRLPSFSERALNATRSASPMPHPQSAHSRSNS
eukprot:377536-Pleurochrysis_carterae.AAC.2